MTEQQAVRLSIAHWRRMIRWVKKSKLEDVHPMIMYEEIKENWGAHFCELCQLHRGSCEKCILHKKGHGCNEPGSSWRQVNYSITEKKWLHYAEELLKVLRSCKSKK